jgi:DNA-binding NarL/FixJ family response regulator
VDRVRLLVVDDHRPFRQGLLKLLELIPAVVVVGEAASGDEAVQQAHALQPDVVLMDLQMPGLNGIDATRLLRETSPHIGVVVLTMSDDDESVFAALRAGARGYLLKGADRAQIARAVEVVVNGEAMFSAGIAQRLVHYFTGLPAAGPAGPAFPQLSEREREVLDLISRGHSNAVIAERLVLSPKTVRNHVSHVFAKLQVADRAQAIITARDAGFGAPPAGG